MASTRRTMRAARYHLRMGRRAERNGWRNWAAREYVLHARLLERAWRIERG